MVNHAEFETKVFDPRMSDAEGLMWRMEKDPHLSSTFAAVTILEGRSDFEKLVRRMEHTTRLVPRLRQRVQSAPANLGAPCWVDDSNFNIRYHVRHVALPEPGTVRQLLDLASLIVNDAFDRSRPLWQFVLVEGVEGGRSALIQKLHHTISDGEGTVKLSLAFLDFAADAPEPEPWEATEREPGAPSASGGSVLQELMKSSLRMPLGMYRQVRDLIATPANIPGAGAAAADTFRGVLGQLSDMDPAKSPLWTHRSLQRRIEIVRAPYAATRAVAKRLGGTLNTAFLTIAADGASRYHIAMGSPVDELRSSMAVSTRNETSGANAFGLVRMLVPTGEMPIAERFAVINEVLSVAKTGSATGALDALAAVASTLPTSVVTRLAKSQSQTVDFATSNVRGAPMAMYVAGAKMLENYPVGPMAGVAFNLTMLSYLGSLDMGINIDTSAVTDPELLTSSLTAAIDSFLAL